jgi:hypothetical protein
LHFILEPGHKFYALIALSFGRYSLQFKKNVIQKFWQTLNQTL